VQALTVDRPGKPRQRSPPARLMMSVPEDGPLPTTWPSNPRIRCAWISTGLVGLHPSPGQGPGERQSWISASPRRGCGRQAAPGRTGPELSDMPGQDRHVRQGTGTAGCVAVSDRRRGQYLGAQGSRNLCAPGGRRASQPPRGDSSPVSAERAGRRRALGRLTKAREARPPNVWA